MKSNFELVRKMGQGAYGNVSMVKVNGKIVCNKETDPDNIEPFLREITNLKICKHPNIIPIVDIFSNENGYTYGMPCVGSDLGKVIDNKRNESLRNIGKKSSLGLDRETVIKYAAMLCKAVDYCHTKGVWHRDLKPPNILVEGDDLYVIDFGISIDSRRLEKLPYSLDVQTLWYRSPEVLLENRFYDEKIDEWSVGCIIAEMINGTPLFTGDSEIDQLFKIFRAFGTPSVEELRKIGGNDNPSYDNYPKWGRQPIKKLIKTNDRVLLQVCKGLLEMDPVKRMSCERAYKLLTGIDINELPYVEDDIEIKFPINSRSDITPRVRSILVKWMYEATVKLKLSFDSFLNAIPILDRVCSMKPIDRNIYQLYGLVSLFLANTLNTEGYYDSGDFYQIVSDFHTIDEFNTVMNDILTTLKYDISYITINDMELKLYDLDYEDKKYMNTIVVLLLSLPETFLYEWNVLNRLISKFYNLLKSRNSKKVFGDDIGLFYTLVPAMLSDDLVTSNSSVRNWLSKFTKGNGEKRIRTRPLDTSRRTPISSMPQIISRQPLPPIPTQPQLISSSERQSPVQSQLMSPSARQSPMLSRSPPVQSQVISSSVRQSQMLSRSPPVQSQLISPLVSSIRQSPVLSRSPSMQPTLITRPSSGQSLLDVSPINLRRI